MGTGKRYDDGFKARAAKIALESPRSREEVANALGVPPTTLGVWVEKHRAREERARRLERGEIARFTINGASSVTVEMSQSTVKLETPAPWRDLPEEERGPVESFLTARFGAWQLGEARGRERSRPPEARYVYVVLSERGD